LTGATEGRVGIGRAVHGAVGRRAVAVIIRRVSGIRLGARRGSTVVENLEEIAIGHFHHLFHQ